MAVAGDTRTMTAEKDCFTLPRTILHCQEFGGEGGYRCVHPTSRGTSADFFVRTRAADFYFKLLCKDYRWKVAAASHNWMYAVNAFCGLAWACDKHALLGVKLQQLFNPLCNFMTSVHLCPYSCTSKLCTLPKSAQWSPVIHTEPYACRKEY